MTVFPPAPILNIDTCLEIKGEMKSVMALLCLLFFMVIGGICDGSCDGELYTFLGDPYAGPGDLSPNYFHIENSEYSTFVYHPSEPGNYPILIWFGGFAGLIPSEVYSELFHGLASQGTICIGFDMIDPFHKTADFFTEFAFLKRNLNDNILPNGVCAVFEYHGKGIVGIGGHSGGGWEATEIISASPEFREICGSVILWDPVGYVSDQPMKCGIPTLITGSGNGDLWPLPCAPKNMSFHRFYREWDCPKLVMNATHFGHCDIIDKYLDYLCRIVCKDGNGNLDNYHRWGVGIMSAMIGASSGNCKMMEYLTNTRTMPIDVSQFQSQFNCSNSKGTCFDQDVKSFHSL